MSLNGVFRAVPRVRDAGAVAAPNGGGPTLLPQIRCFDTRRTTWRRPVLHRLVALFILLRRQPGSDTTEDRAESFEGVCVSPFGHALSFRSEHVQEVGKGFRNDLR
jgi:hypothetical protein